MNRNEVRCQTSTPSVSTAGTLGAPSIIPKNSPANAFASLVVTSQSLHSTDRLVSNPRSGVVSSTCSVKDNEFPTEHRQTFNHIVNTNALSESSATVALESLVNSSYAGYSTSGAGETPVSSCLQFGSKSSFVSTAGGSIINSTPISCIGAHPLSVAGVYIPSTAVSVGVHGSTYITLEKNALSQDTSFIGTPGLDCSIQVRIY